MLELRPSCENCDRALTPDSIQARICSFECTFCEDCVNLLENVCPNCGGGFVPRPIRPVTDWKNKNCLEFYPPSTKKKFRPVNLEEHKAFVEKLTVNLKEHKAFIEKLKSIPPEKR